MRSCSGLALTAPEGAPIAMLSVWVLVSVSDAKLLDAPGPLKCTRDQFGVAFPVATTMNCT
jgi:hypothetical protein